ERRRAAVLEGAHRRVAGGLRVAAEQVAGVREARKERVLDLGVVREDDERLVGGQEVVDPRDRGGELAAGGEALERVELRQALGTQRRGDPRVELAQVQWLLAQP